MSKPHRKPQEQLRPQEQPGPQEQQPKQKEQQQEQGALRNILGSLKGPEQYAALEGEWRRGLKDLQQALGTFQGVDGSARDEPGTIANPTQQLVTAQITGGEVKPDAAQAKAGQAKMGMDDLVAYAKQKGKEAEQAMGKDGPEKEQERGGIEM